MKRIVSLVLLAAMMLTALSACSDDIPAADTSSDTAVTDTTAADTTTAEAVTTPDPNLRENAKDKLPAGLNFDGATVTVLFRGVEGQETGETTAYELYATDVVGSNNVGEPLTDAVWQRNRTVEERLGIKLAFRPLGQSDSNKAKKALQTILQAGESGFDVIISTGNTLGTNGMNAYVRDLSGAPHIDLEQPWWWSYAIDAMSLDGKSIHYLVGDITQHALGQTGVIYTNKALYEARFGSVDDLYRKVLDGKWTIDELNRLVAGSYTDVNGDGLKDEGDIYGLIWSKGKTEEMGHYVMGLNPDLYQYKDGKLTLTLNNDKTIQIVEKLNTLCQVNEGSRSTTGNMAGCLPFFPEGKTVFALGRLRHAAATFREMEQEFAVLTVPKMDENQKEYISLTHSSGTVICVPKTAADKDMEKIGATLEALASEAYRTCTDKYIEVALKAKYSRHELSSQVIDIVLSTLTKNTLDEYSTYFNSLMTKVYNVINSDPNTFSSTVASELPAAQEKWDASVAELTKEG